MSWEKEKEKDEYTHLLEEYIALTGGPNWKLLKCKLCNAKLASALDALNHLKHRHGFANRRGRASKWYNTE